MKGNELRKGNYINDGAIVSGMQCRTVYIQPYYKPGYTTPVTSYRVSQIKPISLTEQWLKDFGFEKDGAYWSHQNLNIQTSQTKTGEQILLVPNRKYAFELKYVHQLQNLYFALTEKELIKQ